MHHRDFDLQALALEGSARWNAQASDRCDGDWCVTGQDQSKDSLVVRRVDLQAAAVRARDRLRDEKPQTEAVTTVGIVTA